MRLSLRALVGSRLLVWSGALGAIAVFGRNALEFAGNDPLHITAPFHASWANFMFAPTARWDSVWYLQVAQHGYFSRASSAFFPLYPLLISLGAAAVGSEIVVGTVISLLAMTVALYFLYLLTRSDMSERAARTTVLLVAFFPTALFLSAVYTESLFLALCVGSLYAARRDRWAVASLLGGLAAATRVNGVGLLVPLVLMYLYGPRGARGIGAGTRWWQPRYRLTGSALWLLLVPVGLAAYLGYLWIANGAPLAPFQVQQQYWRHELTAPFGEIVTLAVRLPGDVHRLLSGHPWLVAPGDPLSWNAHDLVDLGFLLFAVGGVVLAWRRAPMPLFVFGLVYLASVLSDPTTTEALQGFPRYVLVAFPVFMGWGAWLADRPRARAATLTASAALLVVFSGLWGVWAWIG